MTLTAVATTRAIDAAELARRIERRESIVGIIGMGYVGQPLAIAAHHKGFRVIGFDTDAGKVSALNGGASGILTIPDEKIRAMRGSNRFHATSSVADLRKPDILLICVPTPLTRYREPDLSFVEATSHAIASVLRPGQLVCLESTTYPGTTSEIVKPILEESGLAVGREVFLAFSPEREDPGNPNFRTANIPKVVGADDEISLELAKTYYGAIVERVIALPSAATAEAVKLTENIFRCVNIALVNELKHIYGRMGINIWNVIDAASTKPFGFMPFYPGPGLGGHCIPVDPFYLSWKAREYDFATRFIELAGEVNTAMPYHVAEATANALNEHKKSMKSSRILLLGVAYKKDVDDLRESPSLKIMQLFQQRGVTLDYNDPYFPQLHKMRHYNYENMKSVPLNAQTLASYDAVVIATDHSSYDYATIVDHAKLVVDTRNATRRVLRHREKIVLC